MQRQMGPNTILIMDGMNYIKGFRYQMYCAARELKLRMCTVRRSLRRRRGETVAYAASSRSTSSQHRSNAASGMQTGRMVGHMPWTRASARPHIGRICLTLLGQAR